MEKRDIKIVAFGNNSQDSIRAIANKLAEAGYSVVDPKPTPKVLGSHCYGGRHLGVSAYDVLGEIDNTLKYSPRDINRYELYITRKIRRLKKPKKHSKMLCL